MRTLVIAEDLWRRLHGHLLADDEERVAFLLAKPAGPRLVAHDIVLIPDHARRIDSVTVELPALIDVMNRAVLENSTLVEARSHPLSHGRVAFSRLDDRGQAEMVAYLSDVRSAISGDGGPGQWDSERYDRQVRAFGPAGQDAIASARVAIVGLAAGC